MTTQHAPHRCGADAQFPGDPIGSAPHGAPQLENHLLTLTIDAMRGAMRPAGAIGKPSWALGAVALKPLVGTGARATQLGCHISDAIPGQDALDQQQASAWGQTRIRVRHEDLRGVDGLGTSTTAPGSSPGQGLLLTLRVVTPRGRCGPFSVRRADLRPITGAPSTRHARPCGLRGQSRSPGGARRRAQAAAR
jgi:hypothetical protein